MNDLIILGAGDYAKQLFWIVKRLGSYNVLGFYDETVPEGKVYNYQSTVIASSFERLANSANEIKLICAVGNIELRKKWVNQYKGQYQFATIIDPSCLISPDAIIGENVIILGLSVCSIECNIRDHVNINWQCLISHHVTIGEFSNIYSGVKLTGNSSVGKECEIGTGATIIPKKKVGNRVILGAGATVTQDIVSDVTAVGVPARVIKKNDRR